MDRAAVEAWLAESKHRVAARRLDAALRVDDLMGINRLVEALLKEEGPPELRWCDRCEAEHPIAMRYAGMPMVVCPKATGFHLEPGRPRPGEEDARDDLVIARSHVDAAASNHELGGAARERVAPHLCAALRVLITYMQKGTPAEPAPPTVDLSGPEDLTAEEREAASGEITPLVMGLPNLTQDQADRIWHALARMFRAGRRSPVDVDGVSKPGDAGLAEMGATWMEDGGAREDIIVAIRAIVADVRRLRGWV